MRLVSLRCTAILLIGGLSLSKGSAYAERTQPQEEVHVSAVEVPVYVTGPDGRPVSDLNRDEFRLFEDGRPQEIQSADLIVVSPGAVTDAKAAAPSQTALISPSLRSHFVLLFDLVYNDMASIEKARKAAWNMVIHQIPRESPVAVFSINRSHGVVMCTNFTSDQWQIMRALATLGSDSDSTSAAASAGMAVHPVPEDLQAQGTGQGMGLPGGMRGQFNESILEHFMGRYANPEHLVALDRFDRDTYRLSIRDYADDLRSFACSLNVLPGRKTVLFFSAGFDATTGFTSNRETALRTDNSSTAIFGAERWNPKIETAVTDAVSSAMACFSGSDCRLYCIDASGLDASEDPEAQATRQAALQFMASEAGGEVIRNANDLTGPLARVVAEAQQYYLLTYAPPAGKPPDAFRRIKVDVTRPGLDISYRRGYYDAKPFAAYTPLERDLHIARLVNLGVDLEGIAVSTAAYCFPPEDEATGERSQVLVQIAVPGDQVRRLTAHRVEIYAFALDSSGTTRAYFRAVPELGDEAIFERAANGGISYAEGMDLPPGDYSLKVIVRDPVSGLTGLRSRQLSVPRLATPQLRMATPCFVAAGANGLSLRGTHWTEGPAGSGADRRAYPLTFRSKPLVAAAVPLCSAGKSYPLLIKLFDAPIDAVTGRPQVQLSWQVRTRSDEPAGQPAAELVSVNASPGGAAEMLFGIRFPELRPGSYTLVVSADDPKNDVREAGSVDFEFGAAAGGAPGRNADGSTR